MSSQTQAEACLRQALLYLNEEQGSSIALSYNKALEIVNDVYKGLGDTKLVKNDIVKLKEVQSIVDKLLKTDSTEVRYMAKALATLISELLI